MTGQCINCGHESECRAENKTHDLIGIVLSCSAFDPKADTVEQVNNAGDKE